MATNVLFSPSTKRVIWSTGNTCVTGQLDDGFMDHNYIHQAPIGLFEMSRSFTNAQINDWQSRVVNQLWTELKEK